MVDLPNHEGRPSRFSAFSLRFRQWLERDLNESRPFSLLLVVVPILPAIVGGKLGLNETATWILFLFGSPVALGWLIYVIYRRFANAARDVRRSFRDVEARKRGEELPARCSECSAELPAFEPPNDGRSYRFQGWVCENCGTALDELGHRIC